MICLKTQCTVVGLETSILTDLVGSNLSLPLFKSLHLNQCWNPRRTWNSRGCIIGIFCISRKEGRVGTRESSTLHCSARHIPVTQR